MIMKSLFSERTISYLAQEPGLAAGTLFNGAVAGSTSASAMAVGINDASKGIRIAGAKRAAVLIALGSIAGGLVATYTAWVSSSSEKADGASMFQIPDFSISVVDTDDHKIKKGEIDLAQIVPPALLNGDNDLNLYIKAVKTVVNDSVIVVLSGFMYEPTAEVYDVLAPLSLN